MFARSHPLQDGARHISLSFGSRSSSLSSEFRNSEPLLPCLEPPSEKRAIRFRSVIGLSLYRRVFKWTLAVLFLLAVFIFLGTDVSAPRVVQFGKTRLSHLGPNLAPVLDHGDSQSADIAVVIQDGSDKQDGDYDVLRDEAKAKQQADEDYETQRRMPWLRFLHLDGYFHGLRALVNKTDLVPEYPNATHEAPLPAPPRRDDVPVPRVYNPYTADDVRPCYLDEEKQVPAPAMYAYEGVPQHMPDPALGSYDIFGIRDDVCFGRYGPYGLGYSRMKGGAGVGAETENSGAERIWSETGQIDYNNVDWGQAQERCVAVNRHRFLEPEKGSNEFLTAAKRRPKNKLGRMAVVVRCYQGFKWTTGHPQLPRHGDRVVVEIRRRVLGASAASYPRHRRANLGRRPDRPAAPGLAHPTGIPRPSDALERAADASVLTGPVRRHPGKHERRRLAWRLP